MTYYPRFQDAKVNDRAAEQLTGEDNRSADRGRSQLLMVCSSVPQFSCAVVAACAPAP